MNKYKLSKHVSVGEFGDKGVFGSGSKQILLEKGDWLDLIKISSLWTTYKSVEEIEKETIEKFKSIAKEQIKKSIRFLKNGFLIKKYDHDNKIDHRYERNIRFYNYFTDDPNEVQIKIQDFKATLIGCGGIGNLISNMLVNSGVGEITLIDDDVIEITNLTRQILFTENDVGKKKIDVLKNRLIERNSSANINCIDLGIKKESDIEKLGKSDLFIVSADSPRDFILWINKYAVKNKQAYINVGYIGDIAVVGPFYIPGVTSCFECSQLFETQLDKETSDMYYYCNIINKDFKNITFPSTNGVAASYAFMDIIKFIGKFSEPLSMNKRIGIHMDKIFIETQHIHKNKECKICSKIKY